MGRLLPVALAIALATCGSPTPPPTATASPSPASAGTSAPTASPTPQKGPPASVAATVGARIDFHPFDLPSAISDTSWTSPWREPGFAFTRLVPSWNAQTPEGSWITIEAQGRRASGGETRWWGFGTWAYDDTGPTRASVSGQRDADGRVETDTLLATAPLSAYRLRVTIAGPAGTALRLVAAVVSDDAAVRAAPASAHTGVVADLAVPSYSQEIHAGEYPEYDGGGEAWCSPTSTAMVLAHWKRGPSAAELGWVDRRYADPQVDHAARYTYDATYRGTGNWSFNTAYAARYGVHAFVTQLRSLAEAERFIASGIPLVASVTVPPGGLPGFLFAQGTPGHLLVIRGFTSGGDVIANDPAARSNDAVRRVYPRAPFERVWVGGSGGIVYVMHPADVSLPARVTGATPNW